MNELRKRYMTKERKIRFKRAAFSLFGNQSFEFDEIESEIDRAMRVAKENATESFTEAVHKTSEMQPEDKRIKDKLKPMPISKILPPSQG